MANREGILIIDEIPNVSLQFGGGEEALTERLRMCKQQMTELIARDKNHPSVIMWSIANEPMAAVGMRRMTGAPAEPVDPSTTAFFQTLRSLPHPDPPGW